jgi:ABC-type amino acid transport substrate-binding protein
MFTTNMRMRMSRRSPCCLVVFALSCGAGPRGGEPPQTGTASAPAGSARSPEAVAAPGPTGSDQALDARSLRPVLRVGTSGDYAPFSTRDASGAPSGFDIELAESIAQDLGAELRWVAFRWPELSRQVAAGEFDVAMGGVSWQPTRGVLGYMTRAVARGGPCLLGNVEASRVAVNRGGVLESWARASLAGRELVTVDDNLSLPELLSRQQVGAIVTDSFELASFVRPGWAVRCEPARTRKVYWVAPAAGRELGPRIDEWLRTQSPRLQAAARRWFGEEQRLDANTHLVDLLARRLELMPLVGAIKTRLSLPIEDLAREREVLAATTRKAVQLGLPEQPVRELFSLQIELSKAVQRRQSMASSLDLGSQIRPALDELGERILQALVQARSDGVFARFELPDLELLGAWLDAGERLRLLDTLRALGAGQAPPSSMPSQGPAGVLDGSSRKPIRS